MKSWPSSLRVGSRFRNPAPKKTIVSNPRLNGRTRYGTGPKSHKNKKKKKKKESKPNIKYIIQIYYNFEVASFEVIIIQCIP
jgi:hypothetical protein